LPTKIVYFSSLPKTWIKDAGENMAKLANQHHGVDIRVYRCASIYGADVNISSPLNSLMDAVLSNQSDVNLDTEIIMTEEDLVYVEDAVEFVTDTVSSDSYRGKQLNIATGTRNKLSEVVVELIVQNGFHEIVEGFDKVVGDEKEKVLSFSFLNTCQTCFRNISEGIKTIIALRRQDMSSSSTATSVTSDAVPQYSSYHCSGGNQNFRNWKPNSLGNRTFVSNRVCMFENICYSGTELTYFMHPEESRSPSFINYFLDHEFVKLSHVPHAPWHPRVFTDEAIPPQWEFRGDHTWMFTGASFSFNYAHLVVCLTVRYA